MKRIIAITALLLIAAATYITLSGSWIAPRVNKWQASITGENNYYPALTIFILAIPPLLLLLGIRWIWDKKVS